VLKEVDEQQGKKGDSVPSGLDSGIILSMKDFPP